MDDAGHVLRMGVTGGLIALAAATLIGVLVRRRAGQFRLGPVTGPEVSGLPPWT
jgi:hypothetical protein